MRPIEDYGGLLGSIGVGFILALFGVEPTPLVQVSYRV